MTTPLKVPDKPAAIAPGYLEEALRELTAATRRLGNEIVDKSLRVDEYLPQPLYGVPVALTTIELQPQFQKHYVVIEHVIVTGSPTVAPVEFTTGTPVTGPGANVNIISASATVLPPPGVYTVNWQVSLGGTVTAAEADNFKLTFGNTVATAVNAPAIGDFPQEPVQITIPAGNANALAIKSVAAAGAAATYAGQIQLTPAGGVPFTLQFGDRYFNGLSLPSDGCFEMSPKGILLAPSDRRILVSAFSAAWTLELIGFADVRNPF